MTFAGHGIRLVEGCHRIASGRRIDTGLRTRRMASRLPGGRHVGNTAPEASLSADKPARQFLPDEQYAQAFAYVKTGKYCPTFINVCIVATGLFRAQSTFRSSSNRVSSTILHLICCAVGVTTFLLLRFSNIRSHDNTPITFFGLVQVRIQICSLSSADKRNSPPIFGDLASSSLRATATRWMPQPPL